MILGSVVGGLPVWPGLPLGSLVAPRGLGGQVAGTQELVNGTKSPADALKELGTQYQTGVDAITKQ